MPWQASPGKCPHYRTARPLEGPSELVSLRPWKCQTGQSCPGSPPEGQVQILEWRGLDAFGTQMSLAKLATKAWHQLRLMWTYDGILDHLMIRE